MAHELEVLGYDNPTSFDRLVLHIYAQISKLHDQKIPLNEMKDIKKRISEFIRKHNPLEDLHVIDSPKNGSGN